MDERRSDASLEGRTLALHLMDGEVVSVGAFWQSEKGVARPDSYLRLIAEELDELRRRHLVLPG